MIAINHALSGAVIGLTITNPVVALLSALLSHFVVDVIPHFGSENDESFTKSTFFSRLLIIDFMACVLLVVCLMVSWPENWLLASICAFLATSPDLLWINKYRAVRSGRSWQPNAFLRWAARIQWYQRPSGAVVEIIWFGVLSIILFKLIF